MKRIGINALYLIPGGVGGTEIYLRCLLEEFDRLDANAEFVVFTNHETDASILPPGARMRAVVEPVRASFRAWRILHEQTLLPLHAVTQKIDVLLNPGFTAPILCSCPQVTVFHDLQHKRHPEFFRWFDLPFWRLLLFWSVLASDYVIVASAATRDDLLDFYPIEPEKLRLVPHGVDRRFFDLGWQPEANPYVLCVSTLHPHKNLERLVHVFARFRSRHPAFRLVLAGLKGFQTAEIERLIRFHGMETAIDAPGWIEREQLYRLYRGAQAFVYPSTFEGFGLPVLEAMAAGIPTACSGIEPMSGIAADAALKFDPHNDDALLDALDKLTMDEALRARLHSAGPVRARDFGWSVTARRTLDVLMEAAS